MSTTNVNVLYKYKVTYRHSDNEKVIMKNCGMVFQIISSQTRGSTQLAVTSQTIVAPGDQPNDNTATKLKVLLY